ncbi:MAG: hypothetical protein WC869_11795 [Phycisphaerae bacterium]|jgi:hypothetical protein
MTIFKAGETYRTRDGREARVYATDGADNYSIHGAMRLEQGWASMTWTAAGVHCISDHNPSNADLMPPAPKPLEGERWMNIYPNDRASFGYHDERRAHLNARYGRIACIRIDLSQHHEGEGLT